MRRYPYDNTHEIVSLLMMAACLFVGIILLIAQ